MKLADSKNTIPWPLIFVFLVFLLFVISGGILYYKSQKKKIVLEKHNELEAIASLKVEEIDKWRKERIRDGNIIHTNIALNSLISDFLNNDKQFNLKQELLLWMESLIKNYDYQSILLIDKTKTARLSYPFQDSIGSNLKASISEVFRNNKIIFTDLHRSDSISNVHIDMLVPLIDPGKNDGTIFGILVFRINPEISLFPFIQAWPTPSKSSETLLLRREGDSVLYLNELKHQKNTALRLKLPLSNKRLPAAKVASGFEGEFEGLDYRNIPVISYLKKVPDSPWFMVAKVDKGEIYSPLYQQLTIISIITVLLILAAGLVIGLLWRNQRISYFRNQLESEIERRKAKEIIAMLSTRNEAILGSVPNIIMEVDNNKIYTWANNSGYEFFGDDVIGKEVAFYFEGDQDTNLSIKPQYSGKSDKFYVENWHRRKDGEKRLLAWWCKVIKDENGAVKGLLSSASDITERNLAEEKLKENETRLRELNATKDKFFSIIAHDLKSPFNSIIGLSDLLADKMRRKDYDGIEEYASIIQNSSWRAMDLLTNLIVWSRLQTGRMVFKPELVDIVSLIIEVTELSKDSARQKSITILREEPPYFNIFADKAMISTILRNLISNAIKFTNTGGKIVISAVQNNKDAIITVSDNGIGISKDVIEKLFLIEESVSTPGTQNEQGTGLGLILCKEFVLKHGGKIWVESEPGKGSSFIFTLPVKEE
jgi:two-component system sensor histidine kinase/response regulator